MAALGAVRLVGGRFGACLSLEGADAMSKGELAAAAWDLDLSTLIA
jgi:hypothetical protein